MPEERTQAGGGVVSPYHFREVLRGGGGVFGLPALPPSDWLSKRQITRQLLRMSCPPWLCGTM